MTQRRQQWFVEIWKGTTYRRANHFTGSLLWKVSDWHLKWRWTQLNQKVFNKVQNFCPEAVRHVTINIFTSTSMSNSVFRNILLKLQFQTTWMQPECAKNFYKMKMFSVSFLTEGSVLFLCGLIWESVRDVPMVKVARPCGFTKSR